MLVFEEAAMFQTYKTMIDEQGNVVFRIQAQVLRLLLGRLWVLLCPLPWRT